MFKIKDTKNMGRGLFITVDLKKGNTWCFECLEFSRRDTKTLQDTKAKDYVYALPSGRSALALEYGSFFNHSKEPNVDYIPVMNNGRWVIKYFLLKDVKAGEQLFIDYGYDV